MTDICEIIRDARKKGASDIHISEAMPLWYRVNGRLREAELQPSPEEVRSLLLSLLSERHRAAFEAGEDADFSLETPEGERQRVNVFRQQKKLAATIRLLNGRIPSLEDWFVISTISFVFLVSTRLYTSFKNFPMFAPIIVYGISVITMRSFPPLTCSTSTFPRILILPIPVE